MERRLRTVAALGAAVYVLTLLAVPLLDAGRDFLAAHPEDYAAGPAGVLVNLGYAVFALALVTTAVRLGRGRGAGAAAPALLLPPAVLCLALSFDPIAVARAGTAVTLAIAGLAVGPLATALVLGRPSLAVLGGAVLVAFAALAAAPDTIGGAVNRVFDVLAGLWVLAAASTPARLPGPSAPRPRPARRPSP